MERQTLNERIQKDYEDFKKSTLELTKEEIFEAGFEIDFKTYFTEYLQNDANELSDKVINNLLAIDGSILDELFILYLDNDTYYTYDDMCEEIISFYEYDDEDDDAQEKTIEDTEIE